MRTEDKIFKDGSTTYYWSSKFFSKPIKEDVLRLYSFVRVADDLVDSKPQNTKGFNRLKRLTNSKKIPNKTDEISQVVINMRELSEKYSFDSKWVEAFLKSMQADIKKTKYKTLKETLDYIYGSAEVIGLMMAKILSLPPEASQAAKYQGRAMQYINFLRDIDEDLSLGRCYLPEQKLRKHGLKELSLKEAERYPAAYREFIEEQVNLYRKWQTKANLGFKYIPRRQRIALRTAVDMYNWTANKISDDPFVVFEKKVKPSKVRVLSTALLRCIHA